MQMYNLAREARENTAGKRKSEREDRAGLGGGGKEYDYVYATWQLLKVQVRPVCVSLCMCMYVCVPGHYARTTCMNGRYQPPGL